MRENFFWHKVHSLTGVIPVGYYLVQHLALNTFSLAGPTKFNGVIGFFEGMPIHALIALKLVAIWIPLIFHAVYGVFITARGLPNYPQYPYRENRYYFMQRVTGIAALLFLGYHMFSTSATAMASKFAGGPGAHLITYDTWAARLAAPNGTYLILVVYLLGVLVSSYHFSYGLWLFCIRWGITISEASQRRVANFATGMFVVITLMGWLALIGFFRPILSGETATGEAPKSSNVERIEVRADGPTLFAAR